jgi:hypothetical protein
VNNPPTDPIRKSSLPCVPPAEWEFHTWFPHPDGGGDMVRGERQRGVVVRRRIAYGDWEPVRPDRWTDEPPTDAASAGLVAVPPTIADRAAPAVWIDGHPQLEAIAAAVWERCRTEDTSLVVDDPRNIAVAALAAVLGVLPAGSGDTAATRAAVLAEAIAAVEDPQERAKTTTGLGLGWEAARDVLRRLAAETQQPETPGLDDSARIGRTLIWTWTDIGKGQFGEGYRAAQAEARALLTSQRCTGEEQPAPVHVGGNAEDCPACHGTNPPYPFACPGPAGGSMS